MKKMRPLKEKISITIDSDVLEEIREEADKKERSLSQYINLVLKAHWKALHEKEQSSNNDEIL